MLGKAKIEPKHGHTISRLELCAVVPALQLKDTTVHHLKCDFKATTYIDSKIVLNYLNNTKRRCCVYVDNRVTQSHQLHTVDQWCYVPSVDDPTDLATRSLSAKEILYSMWILGSSFILTALPKKSPQSFEWVNPDQDTEI